jgi:hypothetical protein
MLEAPLGFPEFLEKLCGVPELIEKWQHFTLIPLH